MYRILYNESTIFDPYGNENEVVTDASMSVEINAAAYLDFTMSRLHPLYDTIAERDGVVTLYWDQKILFQGVIESIDMDIQGNKSISCVSALDYLNDTVVRPYSTIAGEQELTAPSSVDGYFQWLIDQHNDHVLDAGKLFDVGVNQGANLQQNNFIYRSSTGNPTTASEITDQLLDSLGGYLTMRYVDDRRVLDLYSDIHTMNAQVIDFGVNITDFSKTIDTKDQYTALLLKGGSPEFLGGDFEDGSFDCWVSHPNTPIATGTVHGGTYSSFFTEGNGEYINSSFFYAKKGARYKSTVWIKNERSSTIKAYPRYQVYEAGDWVGKTVDGGYDVPNDGEWHEYSFDVMPNLEDYVRIRPRWVFDTVGNDGNKRVYVDDFDFRQVEGGTDVAEDPISVSMVPDGGMQYDANILKTGDVIYDPTAVARYGYKEKVYEDSTITDVDDLLQAGVKALNKLKDPQIGLDIKAVDLALFMDGYDHLNVGDAVRVRSAIHDTDEFLMVTSITLDLQDPGQSEYNIGKAYDSLTGQQSGFLRSLNSGINSSLDAVASLDQTTKDQAIQIGAVENVANQAKDTANNAQNTANANKEAIDSIKDAQTEYEKQLEQMQQGVADVTEEIGQVNGRIEGMNSEIESAKSDIDSLRSSTETELQNVKQSVSKVQSDVESVSKKAEDLASDLDGTKATVEQVTTDLGEVKTTVSNAATKADQALQVSTSASQTATEAKTTATSAYQDAQSALTQSSTASQTANAVKTELETKYSTTDEIAEQYATKSLVEQTSQSITSTVEATYATKATVEALENIANNAVQTWMGSGVPTLSNKPASDWTTAELKSQHSGDIYYDSDTGYSYRFGSSDGRNYSWSLIKDTDISKAVADAAKAQQTAEGVSDEVTQLKTDIPATYATKTEVKQTTDSIKSTVSEVASTANSALSKATTVEQTANGLQTTVTEQAEKLEGAVTTISQVSQKADSLSSKIEQTNANLDVALSNGFEIIRNPNGDASKGNLDGWNGVVLSASGAPSGCPISTYMKITTRDTNWGSTKGLGRPCRRGRTYRIEAYVACDSTATRNSGFGLSYVTVSGSLSWVKAFVVTPTQGKTWAKYSGTVTVPENITKEAIPWIQIDGSAGSTAIGWYYTGLSVTDITEAKAASDTANSALSQSSTVKQELTSFKTSVQQTYETKNDALNKQSSLQQSVNNLRTEVSETYTTKTEFDALEIGGTNLIQNSTFDSGTKSPWTDYLNGGSATIVDGYDGHKGVTIARSNYTGNTRCGVALYDGFLIKNIQSGDKFTLSAWIRINKELSGTNTKNTIYVRIKRPNSSSTYDAELEIPKNGNIGQWQRISRTFEITNVDENNPVTQMGMLIGGNGSVTISCVKLEKGTKPTAWSPAPEDMLSNAEAAQTYSTKSYVDQTARTVSLGVVEEYKDGQHGSALATQSDITAAKDSITSTVSQTYATKNDVGVGNLIKNGDFSGGMTNWTAVVGTSKIVDGTYGKQLVFTQTGETMPNGSNRIYNASYNHINGQAYEVSFYAKADKSSTWHFGPHRSSKAAAVTLDTTLKQYTMQYQADGTTVLSVWTDNPTATIYLERVKLSIASGYYATKTEVKQTSDSLTVTISSAMSKAESAATAASNAQNTANAAAGSSTNYIKNGGPNGTSNPIVGWTVSGNVYKHTFPGGQNHVDLGYTTLAHPIVVGRTYRLSLDARVTSGTFSSSDYFVFGLNGGWQSIRAQALTSSWKTYSGIVTSTKEATQVFMSSYVGSSGSKVVEMRNVSMTDVTETYNAAIDAQNTANKANSNAQNAQNRVGNLETCIKMTSDGVRVGKISNGNFTGYSALVNSAGSFDILGSDSSVISRFSSKGLQVGSGGDKYHFFVGTGNSSEEAFIGILNDENNDFNAPPDPEAGYSGLFFDRSPQYHAMSLVDSDGGIAITGQGITISANSPSSPLFLEEAGGGITTWSDTKIYCRERTTGRNVNVGANMRVQMKNLNGQAPHYEMTIDRILSNDLGYKLVANGDITSIEIEVNGIYQIFGNVNVYCPNAGTRIGLGILSSPYTAWSSTRDDLVIEDGNTWTNRFFMVSCPLARGNRITWRGSSYVSSGLYTNLCLMYMGPAFR